MKNQENGGSSGDPAAQGAGVSPLVDNDGTAEALRDMEGEQVAALIGKLEQARADAEARAQALADEQLAVVKAQKEAAEAETQRTAAETERLQAAAEADRQRAQAEAEQQAQADSYPYRRAQTYPNDPRDGYAPDPYQNDPQPYQPYQQYQPQDPYRRW